MKKQRRNEAHTRGVLSTMHHTLLNFRIQMMMNEDIIVSSNEAIDYF